MLEEPRRDATTDQARSLRRRATQAERILWSLLRDRRLAGLKFRRQVPFGPYVLDFVCFDQRLVVEADGPFHEPAQDAARDQWLAGQGLRTLRLPNRLILAGHAADAIRKFLRPSREDVSAKLTDEAACPPLIPHPTSFGGHLLPQGEKGSEKKTPPTSPPAGPSNPA